MARPPDHGPLPLFQAKPEEIEAQVAEVLGAWGSYREEQGKAGGLTPKRREIVAKVIASGRSPSNLLTYLRWVFTSDSRWAKWMRKNEGKDYSDVSSLLRIGHLRVHLPEALEWARGEEGSDLRVLPGEEPEPPREETSSWVAYYGERAYIG